jgi:hypothetical protein
MAVVLTQWGPKRKTDVLGLRRVRDFADALRIPADDVTRAIEKRVPPAPLRRTLAVGRFDVTMHRLHKPRQPSHPRAGAHCPRCPTVFVKIFLFRLLTLTYL